MYIRDIEIDNFRCFSKAQIPLLYSGADFKKMGVPRPKVPNVNVILGDNGKGKTAFLMAIALSCLGPAVGSSGIYPFYFVRRPLEDNPKNLPATSKIGANFLLHEQDKVPWSTHPLRSEIEIWRKGDLEELSWGLHDEKKWDRYFWSNPKHSSLWAMEQAVALNVGNERTLPAARPQVL